MNIKISSLERLTKEKVLYDKELDEHEEEVKKLQKRVETEKSNEEVRYDLKTAIRIRDETARMIPSVKSKMREVMADLKSYLKSNGSESDEKAQKAIGEAKKQL